MTYLVSALFGYIGEFEVPKISTEILAYMGVEMVISIVLFKEHFV